MLGCGHPVSCPSVEVFIQVTARSYPALGPAHIKPWKEAMNHGSEAGRQFLVKPPCPPCPSWGDRASGGGRVRDHGTAVFGHVEDALGLSW